MSRIVSFGEVLLRLSPETGVRLPEADSFSAYYGGSEANAAVTCAMFGDDSVFITKVPSHEIGQAAVRRLRACGVDTSKILYGGRRLGIYFCDSGVSVRPTKVVYDRSYSSVTEADPEAYDFEGAFEGADWFHWSGITPAISAKAAAAVERACILAKEKGIKVSCDLNYRGKLWTPEKAQETIIPVMKYVDVCFANESDAVCLGIDPNAQDNRETVRLIQEKYGFEEVFSVDVDFVSSSRNKWTGIVYDGKQYYETEIFDVNDMYDRVGCGDTMAGAYIHAVLKWGDRQKAAGFATAAGALKATIKGDLTSVDEKEVLTLSEKKTKGIQR